MPCASCVVCECDWLIDRATGHEVTICFFLAVFTVCRVLRVWSVSVTG